MKRPAHYFTREAAPVDLERRTTGLAPAPAPELSVERVVQIARDIMVDEFAASGFEVEDAREEPQVRSDGVWLTVRVMVPREAIEARAGGER